MISFTCNQCGKAFKVPDNFAGRSAKCKICGNALTVPGLLAIETPVASPIPAPPEVVPPVTAEPAEPVVEPPVSPDPPRAASTPPPPVAPVKIPMRTRRLRADADAMRIAFQNSDAIQVMPLAGDPPEAYRVVYYINSLEPGPDDKPIPRSQHTIEIQLTSDYPRLSPSCKILTPIFHPNFDHSTICVADHWTAGERLVDLVLRIGEMIAYQAYNIQSPLNGEAAMWTDLNRAELPTDSRNLQPAEME